MSRTIGSRYNIPIALKRGRRLVYNSMTRAMAVWGVEDVAAYEQICAGHSDTVDRETVDALRRGGFIVAETIDELAVLEKSYRARRFDATKVSLGIAPTMACNFVCDYCFQGQDKAHQTMGPAVQDAIVAMIERVAPTVKSLAVTWYGGEPLTRVALIESLSDRLIAVCRAHGLTYRGSVITNGYLLSPETAVSLARRGVRWIQITLDGTPEFHDSRRYLLGGKGSFDRIIENLKAAVELVRTDFAIRINIDERNQEDIRRLIDALVAAGLAGRENLSIYFAPVEAITEGCHNVEDVTLSKRRYAELEAELYLHAHRAGLCGLPSPPRFSGTCAAVRPSSVVVLPTGDLHKCFDTVSSPGKRVGTIFDLPAAARSPMMQEWVSWTPFENETCKNCKILPNCAGACAYKFIHDGDTRGEAAVLPCPSWKYNLKERLIQRAMGKGAIEAADYDPAEIRTVPRELCADTVLDGGKALPSGMKAYYDDQKRIRLPMVRE